MNKTDIVESVANELKLSKVEAQRAVDTVLGSIQTGLKADAKVAISGFGTFTRKTRAARTGINPFTKKEQEFPASVTCGFKPAQGLKDGL